VINSPVGIDVEKLVKRYKEASAWLAANSTGD
jgi:hypothetical protein